MPIRITVQRDYLLTEVNVDPASCSLNDLDSLMKMSKGTGKIVACYSMGGITGVNVEQKTRILENVADKVRKLVGVETTEINGND